MRAPDPLRACGDITSNLAGRVQMHACAMLLDDEASARRGRCWCCCSLNANRPPFLYQPWCQPRILSATRIISAAAATAVEQQQGQQQQQQQWKQHWTKLHADQMANYWEHLSRSCIEYCSVIPGRLASLVHACETKTHYTSCSSNGIWGSSSHTSILHHRKYQRNVATAACRDTRRIRIIFTAFPAVVRPTFPWQQSIDRNSRFAGFINI